MNHAKNTWTCVKHTLSPGNFQLEEDNMHIHTNHYNTKKGKLAKHLWQTGFG